MKANGIIYSTYVLSNYQWECVIHMLYNLDRQDIGHAWAIYAIWHISVRIDFLINAIQSECL